MKTNGFLAGIVITGIFILLGILIFKQIPETNNDLLYMVVGALIVSFNTIISYFFGSSKSSADKNEMIKNKFLDKK